jgi:hypothetical protein
LSSKRRALTVKAGKTVTNFISNIDYAGVYLSLKTTKLDRNRGKVEM